ncbi:MAG: TraR/DksA C4-type zinc finger protein, partial [Syntrophomonadaceae bacterium]|nr:TraR/DksA C4-type zinc finger protein [Syntrophomonadaceae bacterium]
MDYRSRLLAKKAEIEEVVKEKREYLMMPISESIDELSNYDQHPADVASEMFEREKNQGVLELLEFELEKLEDALHRLEQGKYGICELCGQNIGESRLNRVLNTTLCVNCASKRREPFQR